MARRVRRKNVMNVLMVPCWALLEAVITDLFRREAIFGPIFSNQV